MQDFSAKENKGYGFKLINTRGEWPLSKSMYTCVIEFVTTVREEIKLSVINRSPFILQFLHGKATDVLCVAIISLA